MHEKIIRDENGEVWILHNFIENSLLYLPVKEAIKINKTRYKTEQYSERHEENITDNYGRRGDDERGVVQFPRRREGGQQ